MPTTRAQARAARAAIVDSVARIEALKEEVKMLLERLPETSVNSLVEDEPEDDEDEPEDDEDEPEDDEPEDDDDEHDEHDEHDDKPCIPCIVMETEHQLADLKARVQSDVADLKHRIDNLASAYDAEHARHRDGDRSFAARLAALEGREEKYEAALGFWFCVSIAAFVYTLL